MHKLGKKYITAIAITVAVTLLAAFLLGSLITNSNRLSYEAQAGKIYNAAIEEIQNLRGITVPHLPLIVITGDQAVKLWGGGSYTPDLVELGVTRMFTKVSS